MVLDEQERKALYDWAIKIGFIIPSIEDWEENKKVKKLQKAVRDGFRIKDFGDAIEVINIYGKEFSDRKRDTLERLALWLLDNNHIQ